MRKTPESPFLRELVSFGTKENQKMILRLYAIVVTILFISMVCLGAHIDIVALPFAFLGGMLLGIAVGLGCDLEIDIRCKKCNKEKK
jgi:hypothetical protein